MFVVAGRLDPGPSCWAARRRRVRQCMNAWHCREHLGGVGSPQGFTWRVITGMVCVCCCLCPWIFDSISMRVEAQFHTRRSTPFAKSSIAINAVAELYSSLNDHRPS